MATSPGDDLEGGAGWDASMSFDPVLLAVLSSRMELIIREMTNTVMKASRSSVIKNARDMSCGISTYDHRLVSVEEALPIHVNALEFDETNRSPGSSMISRKATPSSTTVRFSASHITPTLTLCVPVFFEGTPLFWDVVALPSCRYRRARTVDLPAFRSDALSGGRSLPVRPHTGELQGQGRSDPHRSAEDQGQQYLVWRLPGPGGCLPNG